MDVPSVKNDDLLGLNLAIWTAADRREVMGRFLHIPGVVENVC